MRLANLWLKKWLSVRLNPGDEKCRYPVGCPGQTRHQKEGWRAHLRPADGDKVKALRSSHAFLRLQKHFNLSKIVGGKLWKSQLFFMVGEEKKWRRPPAFWPASHQASWEEKGLLSLFLAWKWWSQSGQSRNATLWGLKTVCSLSDGPPQKPQEVLSWWFQLALQSWCCY